MQTGNKYREHTTCSTFDPDLYPKKSHTRAIGAQFDVDQSSHEKGESRAPHRHLKNYRRLVSPYDDTPEQFNMELQMITGMENFHLMYRNKKYKGLLDWF